MEFAKLNIANITGNEKIIYFSYLCTSTVIRQTESILLKVGPPWKKISGSAPAQGTDGNVLNVKRASWLERKTKVASLIYEYHIDKDLLIIIIHCKSRVEMK